MLFRHSSHGVRNLFTQIWRPTQTLTSVEDKIDTLDTFDIESKDTDSSNLTTNNTVPADSAGKGIEALTSLRGLFAQFGDTWYDSVVTQAQHALQSARLAEINGSTDEMIAASFLHDVGHLLLDEHGGNEDFLVEDKSHEAVGATYLEAGFPEAVVAPIRLHIHAKRYLCSTDEVYWAGLSDSSKRSFEVQGGKFTQKEAEDFISQPYAKDAVLLRIWDDQAKKANIVTPDLEHYLSGVVSKVILKN